MVIVPKEKNDEKKEKPEGDDVDKKGDFKKKDENKRSGIESAFVMKGMLQGDPGIGDPVAWIVFNRPPDVITKSRSKEIENELNGIKRIEEKCDQFRYPFLRPSKMFLENNKDLFVLCDPKKHFNSAVCGSLPNSAPLEKVSLYPSVSTAVLKLSPLTLNSDKKTDWRSVLKEGFLTLLKDLIIKLGSISLPTTNVGTIFSLRFFVDSNFICLLLPNARSLLSSSTFIYELENLIISTIILLNSSFFSEVYPPIIYVHLTHSISSSVVELEASYTLNYVSCDDSSSKLNINHSIIRTKSITTHTPSSLIILNPTTTSENTDAASLPLSRLCSFSNVNVVGFGSVYIAKGRKSIVVSGHGSASTFVNVSWMSSTPSSHIPDSIKLCGVPLNNNNDIILPTLTPSVNYFINNLEKMEKKIQSKLSGSKINIDVENKFVIGQTTSVLLSAFQNVHSLCEEYIKVCYYYYYYYVFYFIF
jgi:hypothetical protein